MLIFEILYNGMFMYEIWIPSYFLNANCYYFRFKLIDFTFMFLTNLKQNLTFIFFQTPIFVGAWHWTILQQWMCQNLGPSSRFQRYRIWTKPGHFHCVLLLLCTHWYIMLLPVCLHAGCSSLDCLPSGVGGGRKTLPSIK